MMQPRSPPSASEAPRRKRKLPESKAPESEMKTESRRAEGTAEPTEPLGRPFRGKCLYQSRKCENERALKRNGKAHNLCDEHRSKQNQHQRKFDAKKYTRKAKRSADEDADDNKAKRAKTSPEMSAAPVPPADDTSDENYRRRPGLSPTYHDSRPLDLRRPPAVHVAQRSSPPHSIGYSHAPHLASRGRSPLGHVRASHEHWSRDVDSHYAPPATPVDRTQTYHGSPAYPFIPHQPRSRSFDAGLTRISPVGGVAPAQLPFERQRQFLEQRVSPSSLPRHEKLPSLTQLPLARPSPTATYGHSPAHGSFRHSPPYSTLPRPPPANGAMLPSLSATLPRPPSHHRSPSPPTHHGGFAPRHHYRE